MAITLVHTETEVVVTAGTAGTTASWSSTAGSLLVVFIVNTSTDIRTYTVTDSSGNTWTNDATLRGATNLRTAQISSAKNIAGSGTQTVTVTASSSTTFSFIVLEFSGADTVSQPEDASTNEEAVSTTTPNMAAAGKLDSAGACVICGCAGANAAPGTLTAGSGFTKIASANANVMYQYGIFASLQTDNRAPFTCGTARTWSCACGLYDEVVGGGPFPHYIRRAMHGGMIGMGG